MKTLTQKLFELGGTLLIAGGASAQTYSIDTFTIAGGSGTVSGGAYSISGTVGQPDGNLALSGGVFSMDGGFWSILDGVTSGVMPTTIFNNTGGSENGGEGASTNFWLANEFCLGPQAYQLDSVSLLLNSQDFSGAPGPPSAVRLQIYANDPVRGKPSASSGLIMNLSGLTNPITLVRGQQLVKWTPATPLTLAANTCYWVVLSTDSGIIGEIASFTMPTGDAAALGRGASADAGGTWGLYDTSSNRKMLIQAIPVGAPLPSAELAVDGSTAIPSGTGSFTSLPLAPGLSGSNLVFYGAGLSGQGIYLTTRGIPSVPIRIADVNTAIPNGAGNFLSFGTEAGIIIVGGDILFSGGGSGSQQGIYLSSHASPGALLRIADTAMAIPGGVGTFAGFQNGLGFNGSEVVFAGNGSSGQQGIYAVATQSIPPDPVRLADTTTAIPSGNGNFTRFPSGPALSGSAAAFIANGSGGQQGLYTVPILTPPQVGVPMRIADTSTSIPGGAGTFTSFGSDQAHPVDPALSGDRLAFVGSGPGGQQGIYGASVAVIGPPYKVADTTTAIPGGSGNFTSFGAVSVSATDVAFLGRGAGVQTGIYDMTGGQLGEVVSVGERIQGKMIAGLSFTRSGLFGDPIAFQATFSDGSQGVYTIDVATTPAQLRIIAMDRSGSDLRLSFTSVAGQNYAIQSRADLTSGTWTPLAGASIPGDGGTVALTLTNALNQPQQFYRVKIVP